MSITRPKIKKNRSAGSPRCEAGFTILEVIVGVGIFAGVISLVTAIFLASITNQRKAIAIQNVQDTGRFVLEAMAREIRVGKTFSTADSGQRLNFINSKGQNVAYRLNNNAIEKSTDGGTSFSSLTPAAVSVQRLKFSLVGEAAADQLQPRVTVVMELKGVEGSQESIIDLQTTVSQRILDS